LELILEYTVGLKEMYPEDEDTNLDSLLYGMQSEMAIRVGANFLAKKEIYTESMEENLDRFFNENNYKFKADAYQRLIKLKQKLGRPIRVITQPAILSVLAYANNHLNTEQLLSDEQIEVNFFKSVLFINASINQVEQKISDSTKNIKPEIAFYAPMFTHALRFSDFVNYDLYEVFFSEYLRSILLFEFLKEREDAKYLLNEFEKIYDIADWKDYLKRVSIITMLGLKKEKEGYLELDIPRDNLYETNIKFLDILATIKYDELTDSDFKVLREKPLYKIADGRYLVISELFAAERIFKGLYFSLKSINETLPAGQKIKEFRTFYTFNYSEKYALYEILKKSFSKKNMSFSGEYLDSLKISGAPDYYVRNKNKLYLFESKDSLINASLKDSGDYSLLEEDVKKKFYIDKDGRKGVKQLFNFITTVFKNGFLSFDNTYNKEKLRIYPIIVIHDRQLDVPGFNKILNHWFNEEIKNFGSQEIEDGVYPITVIDISTLILVHELLLDRRLLLEKVIEQYHEFVRVKHETNYTSIEHFKKHLMDTAITFSFYIRQEVRKKELSRSPHGMIMEKAGIAMEQ